MGARRRGGGLGPVATAGHQGQVVPRMAGEGGGPLATGAHPHNPGRHDQGQGQGWDRVVKGKVGEMARTEKLRKP
jgi:hypothetical protein